MLNVCPSMPSLWLSVLTPRFASTCVWLLYGADICFGIFKDGANQGKWTKETAERTTTQGTAKPETGIRLRAGEKQAFFLALKQAAGHPHPCMRPKKDGKYLPSRMRGW